MRIILFYLAFLLILPPPAFCAEEEAAPEAAAEEQAMPERTQDNISLDLKNVDIIELLRIISLKTGKTIVPSKGVSGRITVYLNNVAFNDVLDIIVLTQGLAMYQKEHVYYIMTAAEYKKLYGKDYLDQRKVETYKLSYAKPSVILSALEQLKSETGKIVVDEASGTLIFIELPEKIELFKKTIRELDQPLDIAVFDLNYAKAADAKTQLTSAVTQGTGEVIVDERSSKAIISDLPKKMEKLGMLVREIDEGSRQVYVEADIVELTLSDKFQRGIDWEKVYSSAMDGLAFTGYFPLTLSQYQKISVGTLARDKYDFLLNYLDTYGTTNIISQPRIAVVNNEEANVMVGVREAYITQTQSQATSTTVTSESVEFVDVGVKLTIVPRIGADGYITMKLKPEVSSVKETITTELGSRVPIVQTSQSETVVKVKDGMMIMIAGMIKTELVDAVKGWPILCKIPFLGAAFGSRETEKKKTEIIIFLTPHIVSGKEGLRGKDIEKIVPGEYLPDNLQKKVVRDQVIDKTLAHSDRGIFVQAGVDETPGRRDAKEYYQRGLRAQKASDNQEALACFQKAADLDNNFAAAYNSLGIIYEQEGHFDQAEQNYLRAVAIDPNYVPAYSNLALFNEARGDLEKAVEYWRKRAIYGDPNDAWTKEAIRRVRALGI